MVEQTGGRHWEAELYRLQAEFLLPGDDPAAETSSAKAIKYPPPAGKSWELALRPAWLACGKARQNGRSTPVAGAILLLVYGRIRSPDLKWQGTAQA
jgi:hypothetical protein